MTQAPARMFEKLRQRALRSERRFGPAVANPGLTQ